MIYIESKKKKLETLLKLYPNSKIIDVTSKAKDQFVRFSPFYPHNDIPIPFSEGITASSVEGIWQGLKVFEKEGIDASKFLIKDMKGIKRTVRKFGKPLGHKNGVNGTLHLDYLTARKKIYLPAYAWVLQNKLETELEALRKIAELQDLVLLDYETNEDIENVNKPLSHAALVKKYLIKKYPALEDARFVKREVMVTSEKVKADVKKKPSTTMNKNGKKIEDKSQLKLL